MMESDTKILKKSKKYTKQSVIGDLSKSNENYWFEDSEFQPVAELSTENDFEVAKIQHKQLKDNAINIPINIADQTFDDELVNTIISNDKDLIECIEPEEELDPMLLIDERLAIKPKKRYKIKIRIKNIRKGKIWLSD